MTPPYPNIEWSVERCFYVKFVLYSCRSNKYKSYINCSHNITNVHAMVRKNKHKHYAEVCLHISFGIGRGMRTKIKR